MKEPRPQGRPRRGEERTDCIRTNLDIHGEARVTYLRTCARIRGISCTELMGRLLDVIMDDQLVLSILDDDSKPSFHHCRTGRTRSYYKANQAEQVRTSRRIVDAT